MTSLGRFENLKPVWLSDESVRGKQNDPQISGDGQPNDVGSHLQNIIP